MEIKEKIKERNEKFYTKKGINALRKRLENWVDVFNNNHFPFNGKMLGFGNFEIKDRKELQIRIKELCELIGEEVIIKTETTKDIEGIEIIKKTMEIK